METSLVSLTLIILFLVIERYFYAKEMNKQIGEATRAILSRNINEFITATTVSKTKDEPEPENEEVLLTEADDNTFKKAIQQINK